MKQLIFIILIMFCTKIMAQDTCSPMLQEIYDFEIGDVFQYNIQGSNFIDGPLYDDTIIKYTIIDKYYNSDTIRYIRTGISRNHTYYTDGYNKILDDYGYSVTSVQDTLVIIDSTHHMLNKCKSDTVRIVAPYCNEGFYNYIVNTTTKDGLFIKSFEYVGSNCSGLLDDYIEYAKGLGKISQNTFYFEAGYFSNLVGYVKSGDTTGIISSDEELTTGILSHPIEKNVMKIYPNPVYNESYITIDNLPLNSIIQIISIDGKINILKSYNDNQVKILDLPEGIYLIKAINKNQVQIGKLIKY